MLISKKADLLSQQIRVVEKAGERSKKIDSLKKLSTKLSEIDSKIEMCLKTKEMMGLHASELDFKKIEKEIANMKEDLVNEREDERITVRINSNIDEILSKLRFDWRIYSEKRTEGIRKTLTNIRHFFQSDDQGEIERLINDLERFKEIWPLNSVRYDKFNKDIDLAKDKIAKLELTEEIRVFIQKTSENKATLADLTPEIIQWLKINRYEEKIKLKF